jgi:uncharacterized membrane protein HdeD (DUF308 family)
VSGFYHRSTFVFGILAIVLGIAILAETARAGGGSVGYLFGALFVALGCGRIYLLRHR